MALRFLFPFSEKRCGNYAQFSSTPPDICEYQARRDEQQPSGAALMNAASAECKIRAWGIGGGTRETWLANGASHAKRTEIPSSAAVQSQALAFWWCDGRGAHRRPPA